MDNVLKNLTFCDLTQSFSAKGGGIRTFLSEKRRYILENSDARHVLIVPGDDDRVFEEAGGRLTRIEIRSPQVPGSPNYRLMVRQGAVLNALKFAAPHFVECLDAYNLPWAALTHRARFPDTRVIAGYHTDFPTVYVEKYAAPRYGAAMTRKPKNFCYYY